MAPKKVAKKEETAEDGAKEEEPKVEDKSAEAAAPKAAEVGEAPAKEEEKPKEPEKPKELEEDAPVCSKPKVKAADVKINLADTTLNVLPTHGGQILGAINDGGLQYLLAGARAGVGVKAGRYLFEVRLLEALHFEDSWGLGADAPAPKSFVRVGLSTEKSELFLGEGQDNVAFDSEGMFMHGKGKNKMGYHVKRGCVMGLLLNLDEKSENANTVSLFVDGKRRSKPQPLPENLKGKTLFPTVTYRSATLQVNLGPEPLAKLPFTCTMVAEAAKDDAALGGPKTGPREVVFPVGLPDEGAFDWVDHYLESHPDHEELSERRILRWGQLSGLWRQGGYQRMQSNDQPGLSFGIPPLDDLTVLKVLGNICPLLERSYVVMEVKSNLIAAERAAALAGFRGFKKIAVVAVGEPPEKQKTWAKDRMIATKKAKAEKKAKRLAEDKERKRIKEEKQAEHKAKRAKTENGAKEEKDEEDKAVEPAEAAEPAAEDLTLTEEEQKLWFVKSEHPDMVRKVLCAAYAKFSLPEKDEGFAEVQYPWLPQAKAAEHLRQFVLKMKQTVRVNDLKPGAWFKEEYAKWDKANKAWRKQQQTGKKPAPPKKEGEEEKTEEEKKEEKKDDAEKPKIEFEDVDVFKMDDVTDIGDGRPLFLKFKYEDWTLLSLRFELHILLHAFRKDLDDEDRKSFTLEHLAFYYNKYFSKNLSAGLFGCEKMEGVLDLVKNVADLKDDSMLEPLLGEETPMDNFVKLAEEDRRERLRRIDAGDESAWLKFSKTHESQGEGKKGKGGGKKGGGGHERGKAHGKGDRHGKSGKAAVAALPAAKQEWKKPAPKWNAPARHGGGGEKRWGGAGGGSQPIKPWNQARGNARPAAVIGAQPWGGQKRAASAPSYPTTKHGRTGGHAGGKGGRPRW